MKRIRIRRGRLDIKPLTDIKVRCQHCAGVSTVRVERGAPYARKVGTTLTRAGWRVKYHGGKPVTIKATCPECLAVLGS